MDKDELIDIWREVVLKNTTNGSCNFQQAAIDFAELVAKPWVETNKALANEIIELQKQAEQEPVAWATFKASELSEIAKRIDADDSEGIDSWSWRMGALWAEQRLQKLNAAPVRTKDLTDDEIDAIEIITDRQFARAVIAADREKNNANNNS